MVGWKREHVESPDSSDYKRVLDCWVFTDTIIGGL